MQSQTIGPHTTVLFGTDVGKYPDGNSVLVRGRDATMLIDASMSSRSADLDVDVLALTHSHEDHFAGVSAVRHRRLVVHEADVAALRSTEALMRLYGLPEADWAAMAAMLAERFHHRQWDHAEGFVDGAVFDLGGVTVRAVHAPGHTSGHSVYVVEPDGVVVTGDIDLSSFGPYYGDAQSDLDAFEATLRMVAGIEAAHYVTFHHKGVVEGHPAFAAAVADYAKVIDRRSGALLDLLDEPRSLDQLVDVGIVYRPGTRPPVFGTSVERHTIERHLDRLQRDGVVCVEGQEWRRA